MYPRCFLQILTLFFFVFIKAQNAGEWVYSGPGETYEQVKGFMKALYIDPSNSNFVLAGSGSGGLFKTENANDKIPVWTNITDTYEGTCFGVSDIVVIPKTNNKSIFISTSHLSGLPKGYGNGILKSSDGGLSWQQTGPVSKEKDFFPVEGLIANPENYNEMIAYGINELYLTTDAWKTYSAIEMPIDKTNRDISFCDAEFAPFEPGKFYICTRYNNKAAAQVFVCRDYGKIITDITPADVKAYRIEVATVRDEKYKGRFYIAHGFRDCFIKYFNGKEFSKNLNSEPVNHTFANAYWCFELSVNQTDTNIIYLSLTETSRSTDGGRTFRKLNHYNSHNTHADVRAALLYKSSVGGTKDEYLVGNDGGVSFIKTFDPPEWKSMNGAGLDANQFWGLSVLQSDTFMIAGGTQDNGGFILTLDTSFNTMYTCGDAYLSQVVDKESVIIQCNAPSMFYHNIRYNTSYYLNVPDKFCEGKRPIVMKDSVIFFGYHDIWKINKSALKKSGAGFTNISNIKPVMFGQVQQNKSIRSMAISDKNTTIVCYSHPNWEDENKGKVFFCSDINAKEPVFNDITALLHLDGFEVCRWTEVWTIEFDLDNPFQFYFTSRDPFNQTNFKLFSAEYFPDSNKCSLRNVTSDLPNTGINKIKTDKFSSITYVATDKGVYWTNLKSAEIRWKNLNSKKNKLPVVSVMDIDFNYSTNTLYAATYGRGVWHTQLVSGMFQNETLNKSLTLKDPFKIDGQVSISKKKQVLIKNKLIFTNGSTLRLGKKSRVIIRDRMLIRDENNNIIENLTPYIKKGKKSAIEIRN